MSNTTEDKMLAMTQLTNTIIKEIQDSGAFERIFDIHLKLNKLHEDAVVPTYGTSDSACFDLFPLAPVYIKQGESKIIRTGLAFEIPKNHVMLVFSRSGHGFKYDARLSNCVGVIDADYRDEVKIKIRNDGELPLQFGSQIACAQAMVIKRDRCVFDIVDTLEETDRNGGFGSTDKAAPIMPSRHLDK